MIHTLLNGESPEVIRYFRHLEYLATLWEKDKEKYRPHPQREALPYGSRTVRTAQGHATYPDRTSDQWQTPLLQVRRKGII